MRTRKGSKTALVLAAAGSLVLSAAMSQAADISVGDTTVRPDETGNVTVSLNVEAGETAVGTLNDMSFEPGAAVPARAVTEAVLAADISATATAIPVGDAADLQAFGTVQIDEEMIAYGEKRGDVLVAGGCTGGDSGTACVESSECTGDGTCEPSGRGQGLPPDTVCPGAAGCPAPHPMNTAVEVTTAPNCTMSADLSTLMKDAVFSYLPDGCVVGSDVSACNTVRGIVIALDNLTQFPEGITELYTCTIAAGADEDTFTLGCLDGQVSSEPDGEGLIASGPCADGEVVVTSTGCTCVGDQDGSGSVSSGEATRSVLALIQRDPSLNPAADCDASGSVSSGEATRAVLNLIQRTCNP